MSISYCVSCKGRVEEGAVRCVSCGAQLDRPGAFLQVLGWVVVAISTIPLAISEVTTAQRDITPLILGVATLILGIVMVVMGKSRTKASAPTVVSDPAISPNP